MSRVLHMHRIQWALLGLVALTPLFTGQSGCPLFLAPVPGGGQAVTPPSDAGKTTPSPNAAPNVTFTSPAPGARFGVGDAVRIAFDAGDAENDFSYDLVYDNDGTMNGNENRIESRAQKGSSAVVTMWDTTGLPVGTYYIGVIVIDNAGNTDTKFLGPIILSGEPTLLVTAPAAAISAKAGDAVTISFVANVPVGDATIDVFYDTDTSFANGVIYIAQGLSKSATSQVWNTAGVANGTYYVGASIVTSAGRIARYAPGWVTIGSTGGGTSSGGGTSDLDIRVTQPAGGVTMVSVGAQVLIEFRGTDPKGTATIDLFYVEATDVTTTLPLYTG
ncbi:MAG: hypothetical protein ACPMAQ_19005, partial [Phycisphaerae bacterium]